MKVMKQLSFFLENKPGVLARVCKALAQSGVNVRAIAVSDTVDHAVVRMVVSESRKALDVLDDANILVIENDVGVVDLRNTPGEMAKLAGKLGRASINIEYAYGCASEGAETAPLVLRLSDLKKAVKILK